MAPEANESNHCPYKADIFSVGCIIFFLCTGSHICTYKNCSDNLSEMSKNEKLLFLTIPHQYSPDLRSLML